MGLLDNVKSVLAQYASGAAPTGDATAHFQEVAQSLDASTVAQGIAAAMRSDQTPPFAQMVSQQFASATPEQKSAMLNALLSSLSPERRGELAALIPGFAGAASVTSGQASTLSPTVVQTVAQHAEQHDGGIIDKMSALYAAHPTLVKTLGTAAMVIAMRQMAEQHMTT